MGELGVKTLPPSWMRKRFLSDKTSGVIVLSKRTCYLL